MQVCCVSHEHLSLMLTQRAGGAQGWDSAPSGGDGWGGGDTVAAAGDSWGSSGDANPDAGKTGDDGCRM